MARRYQDAGRHDDNLMARLVRFGGRVHREASTGDEGAKRNPPAQGAVIKRVKQMNYGHRRVCPVEMAGGLDNVFRRWAQKPSRILGPYIREGMTVLDMGCGPGFFTLPLAHMVGIGGRVIAVDLQKGMLDKVRRKIRATDIEPRIILRQCGENDIGVAEKVDFVLLFYVVHEIKDKARFFADLSKLLPSAGQALVVEPPFHVSKTAFGRALGIAKAAGFTVHRGPRVFLGKSAILRRRS